MSDFRSNARLVFSTGGEVCSGCGWPKDRCVCSKKGETPAAIPARPVAKLRMEKAGRGGKMVTVVDGLPKNDAFLKELCGELKRLCGTGGTVQDGAIELQGDLRERIRPYLQQKHYIVKG